MDALHEIAVQPHLWIVPAVALVVAAVGVPLIVFTKRDEYLDMMGGWQIVGSLVTGLGGLLAVAWLVMLIPFQSQYHVLYQVEGTVESVTNAFESGSGDLTSSPVVRLDTLDRAAVVSDPRIMDLVDQEVTLLCSVEWVPYGLDRLDCSIASIK